MIWDVKQLTLDVRWMIGCALESSFLFERPSGTSGRNEIFRLSLARTISKFPMIADLDRILPTIFILANFSEVWEFLTTSCPG
jgi:hypothetical protein